MIEKQLINDLKYVELLLSLKNKVIISDNNFMIIDYKFAEENILKPNGKYDDIGIRLNEIEKRYEINNSNNFKHRNEKSWYINLPILENLKEKLQDEVKEIKNRK